MKKTSVLISLLFFLLSAKAQLSTGVWMAEGEYSAGAPITMQMKQMAAEKKLEINITESGSVSGNLITRYNKSKASNPQEGGDEQYFTLTGKFEPSEKTLLLILTHLNIRPQASESLLTFAKPDSLYYDLKPTIVTGRKQSILKAIARNPEKNIPLEECVGSPFYGGLGMDKSDHKNAHLLPLLISFANKGISSRSTAGRTNYLHENSLTETVTNKNDIQPGALNKTTAVSIVPKTELIRKTRVQKTIQLDSREISIALYDNGEIDGDIATLILDGKVIIDKHLLSTKPAMISLVLSDRTQEHVLEMYAENLGTIPPNTALIVLTSNHKRYEINLSSSEKSNEGVKLVVGK